MFWSSRFTLNILRTKPGIGYGSIQSDTMLCLLGPARYRVYPVRYVEVLRSSDVPDLTNRSIREFNQSSAGRALIAEAMAEFEELYLKQLNASRQPGYITALNVARLLGIQELTTIEGWCKRGILEYQVFGGVLYVNAAHLKSTCSWRS
jgi:hypothetical protein